MEDRCTTNSRETLHFEFLSDGTPRALKKFSLIKTIPYKRILLVEENEVCRNFLAQLLSSLGYAITEANTGLDGIYKAATELPDLIMMGADLPQLTGIEVTAWLKKHPYTKDIPVLIYTPSRSSSGDLEAFSAGAFAVVNDPIDVDVLRKTFQLCFPSRKEALRDAGHNSKKARPPIGRYP